MAENKKKNLRLNIYLSPEDKKILNEIKYKYQLSYSTIARLIGECVGIYMKSAKSVMNETYIYQNDKTQSRTCIKPRKTPTQDLYITAPTIYYTNVLKAYCRNKLIDLMEIKNYKKFQDQLLKAFKEEKDPNWNGNEWQRRLPKMIKQNKEYYRKLLEEE